MTKELFACTYDVCEHEGSEYDMNEYKVDVNKDLEEQVKKSAEIDHAPLVKVFEIESLKLYKAFEFEQYKCNCEKQGK
ncbi:hypothetical protein [Bacillus rhizoplanae]|uniref:hypothetical protein n=1 Tax=Bacillus rhizoplanae TaxID=2880966 RepID=UPI003D23B4C1